MGSIGIFSDIEDIGNQLFMLYHALPCQISIVVIVLPGNGALEQLIVLAINIIGDL